MRTLARPKPDNQRMEALATVIFERTPSGAVAIKATGDEVPRRLRTLLLAVDGRSPVAQYVPFLTAFAPLSEKFAELEQMGYLRRKGGVAPGAASTDTGFVPIAETDLMALATSSASTQASPVADQFELELQALARQMAGPAPVQQATVQVSAPSMTEMAFAAKPNLSDLLREMDQFLSASAGVDALPISLMLEQIRSLSQLRAELPAYFELVQRYGDEAERHIERVAGMLDQAGD